MRIRTESATAANVIPGTVVRRTHHSIRSKKEKALNSVFKIVRLEKKVKLNDLYEFFSEIWNSKGQFIQDAMNSAPIDIRCTPIRKAGTIAELVEGTPMRRAIMGGLFPREYEGIFVTINPSEGMKPVKKIPKMFAKYGDTKELYRIDHSDKPVEYLQVTPKGNFLFRAVSTVQ